MKKILGIVLVFLWISGCGEQDKARTRVTYSKLAGSASLETSSDQELHIGKMGNNKGPGTTSQPEGWYLQDVDIVNSSSSANASIPQVTDANTRYQAQLGTNAIGIIRQTGESIVQPLAQLGFPVLGQAIAGHYSVAELKAMKPSIVNQAVGALVGGVVDKQGLAATLPADFMPDIDKKLAEHDAATEARLKAQFSETLNRIVAQMSADFELKLAAMNKKLEEAQSRAPAER